MPPQGHESLGGNVDVRVGLGNVESARGHLRDGATSVGSSGRTSTVSSTLTTPGCRSVRSFFSAFLARGSRALLAATSNENMLQFEPSSCGQRQPDGGGAARPCCRAAAARESALTRRVPLYMVQTDWSKSTRSPQV